MVKAKSTFILYVDASNTAVGAALHQQTQGREAPVAYSSKKLSAAERNYAARDKELLALVSATKTWRHYLMGRPFVVMSDHESLKYLTTMDLAAGGKTGRLARWMEHLADYDFTIKHIRGAENGAADGLSRIALNAIERRPQVVSSIQNGESNGGIRKLIPWSARAVF